MKPYKSNALVKISRYQNYFPTLSTAIQQDIYQRMSELLEEEKAYCDKGNYEHIAQIVTSIAIYEVLQRHGKSEEEAYKTVSEEMWKFLDPSGMQKLAKKSFFLPLMKKIVPIGFRKKSGVGWRYTWHKDDPKDVFHFECNECIYAQIFGRRGLMTSARCAVTPTSSTTANCTIPILSVQKRSVRAEMCAISSLSVIQQMQAMAGNARKAPNYIQLSNKNALLIRAFLFFIGNFIDKCRLIIYNKKRKIIPDFLFFTAQVSCG